MRIISAIGVPLFTRFPGCGLRGHRDIVISKGREVVEGGYTDAGSEGASTSGDECRADKRLIIICTIIVIM